MDTENAQEKANKQTALIFDMTEKPLMEYISTFMEEPANVIFKDEIPDFVNPIIMKPIIDYKKNKYLKFSLKSVKQEEEYNKPDIKELMKYEQVRETIGFIFYALKICYASIIASAMINNKPLINTALELNEQEWSFQPTYKHSENIKKEYLQNTLGKLVEMRNNINTLPKETQDHVNKDYLNVMTQLSNIKISQEMENEEKQINDEYASKTKLVIVVDEMLKKDLPKPPKNEGAKLAPVSNTQYTDPS